MPADTPSAGAVQTCCCCTKNTLEPAARTRYLLVAVSVLHVFFYGGAFFGWGPMQVMLEDDGAFSDECFDDEENCVGQSTKLQMVHLIASSAGSLLAPLLGDVPDRWDTRALVVVAGAMLCFGLLLLIVASLIANLEVLLFIGFTLDSLQSTATLILTVQTGMLFWGRTRHRVIGVLNSAFDGGSVTFLILHAIWNAAQAPLYIIFVGYLIGAAFLYGWAVYLWSVVTPSWEENKEQGESTSEEEPADDVSGGSTFDSAAYCHHAVEEPCSNTVESDENALVTLAQHETAGQVSSSDEDIADPQHEQSGGDEPPRAAAMPKSVADYDATAKELIGGVGCSLLNDEHTREASFSDQGDPCPEAVPETDTCTKDRRVSFAAFTKPEERCSDSACSHEMNGIGQSLQTTLDVEPDPTTGSNPQPLPSVSLATLTSSASAEQEQDPSGRRETYDKVLSARTLFRIERFASVVARERSRAATTQDDGYVKISLRTPGQQLRSALYIMLALFYSVNNSRIKFILTTTKGHLVSLSNEEEGDYYTQIFVLLLPVSIIAVPFVDIAINRWGFIGAFHIINILGIIQGIIQVTVNTPQGQIAGFVVFSFYSSFLYTSAFSIIPAFLSSNVVGKATGLLTFVTGIVSLINIPLVSMVETAFDGDFFWAYVIYTLLLVPCIVAVCYMGRLVQLEAQADEEAARSSFLIRYPPGGSARSIWNSSIWQRMSTRTRSARSSAEDRRRSMISAGFSTT